MAHFENWIEGITASHTVREAAVYSLRVRLAATQYYLPRAARQSQDDVEYVHRLRVSTRRSLATVKLYAKLIPGKQRRWFRKTLRHIRHAAGEARDMDVLLAALSSGENKAARAGAKRVRQRRRQVQAPIIAIDEKLRRDDRLLLRSERLLARVAQHNAQVADKQFGSWARRRLRKTVERFFDAAPTDFDDLASIHRFRIRGKELRYAMELLAPAFPSDLRDQLYPTFAQIQEHLGNINDSAVAKRCFTEWMTTTKQKAQVALFQTLVADADARLHEQLGAFSAWWHPESPRSLHATFRALLQSDG